MIFRQFFDSISSTYTYLISSGHGREALIIDPVLEKNKTTANPIITPPVNALKGVKLYIYKF